MKKPADFTRAAKKRMWVSKPVGLVSTVALVDCVSAFVDAEHETKILRIDALYTILSDTGTVVDDIYVGTAADADHYAVITPVISQATGTVQAVTLLNGSDVLPAGTALMVTKEAVTATNTGAIAVVVHYETHYTDSRP